MGMGMNEYYTVLNVSKTAGDEELRRAYKNLAMRWHPDKHPTESKHAVEVKFKQICEAYGVLSNSHKRQVYDLYGEEGLKYYVSSPVPVPRKGTSFSQDDIFADLFRDLSGERTKKAAPVENKLTCTLEELYKGSKRKMQISRIVPDHFGKPVSVEEVLEVDIRPGWKKGTKITFPEKGNQQAGIIPGDLIFVIHEKPHSIFERDGNDLLISVRVSLLDALTGKTLTLTTLDGRNLTLQVYDIVNPGHEIVIPNEGMPISKEPKKRGDLRIMFDVRFPSRLSLDQKADLRKVLGRM